MSFTSRNSPPELLLSFFGCSLVAIGTVHAVRDSGPVVPRALEWATITLLSASSMLVGVVMSRRLDRAQFKWVLYSTLGLGALTGTLSWLVSAVQLLQGYSLNEPIYYGFTMMAGGAAAGPFIGFFYAQLRRSNAELNHRYEEMVVLNRRLEVANRVLRHNLRNKLTVITGVTGDLRRRTEADTLRDRVDMLDRQADELTALSEKMGQIRQVWETNERTDADLTALAERSVSAFQSAHPDVTVRTAFPETAPVTAHPKIETALREVLENAVQHNDASSLTIDVRIVESDSDTVTLRVADDGTGLPDIEQSLFAETDPTMSALEHGIGLGLWLVYWTVEKSGGSLSVANDDGAVVSLELPRQSNEGDTLLVRPSETLQRDLETAV